MGPITLFDKSFLQMISVDESVWFDRFFTSLVCPVFYVETLGNLAKDTAERAPEVIVREMARKFPEMSGSPSSFHCDLVANNLLGNRVNLRSQIPRPGGRPVKSGTIFGRTPEEEAFGRWRKGEFHDVERIVAVTWRKALAELDLPAVRREMQLLGFAPSACGSLTEAESIADKLVNGTDKPFIRLGLALKFFDILREWHEPIARAWQDSGKRTLAEFAPYAAYALKVEIFFQVALGAGLIGGERPSDRSDIAYLFYLPFATLFVSSDKLHRKTAPLFMRPDQEFVWGHDLKPALKAMNEHFLGLPEATREKGIMSFASAPPDGNLVADIWARHVMGSGRRSERSAAMTPEQKAELMERFRRFREQPTLNAARRGEDEMMAVERSLHAKRGNWWQLPKGYKEAS